MVVISFLGAEGMDAALRRAGGVAGEVCGGHGDRDGGGGVTSFIFTIVGISLSGVMAPGPITAATLAAGERTREGLMEIRPTALVLDQRSHVRVASARVC